jgi:hypothetical protein
MATKKQRDALKPEELSEGKMAVAQVRGQLDAFDDEGLRTPRKEQLGAVRDVLARHGALIGGLDKIPKTVIAPELLKAIKEDAAEVPTLCKALIYTETRVLELRLVKTTDSDMARLRALREQGLGVLRLLVAAGHVEAAKLQQITRGNGLVDHARDAVQIAGIIDGKKAVAEQLQALQSDEGKRLAADERAELHKLGMAALAADKAASSGEDALSTQERRYAILVELIKARWDRAVRALAFAKAEGADLDVPPTFTALSRA